jgi:hypothetical protein
MLVTAPTHFIAAEHGTTSKRTHLIFIYRDSYLISASFITTHATKTVSIVWMSRPQNFTVVSTCVAPNWTCVEVSLGFVLHYPAYSNDVASHFVLHNRPILNERQKTNG